MSRRKMGQYWKLINLDKRETYWVGKLGECLFNGIPICLNQSLRISSTLPDCNRLLFPFKPGALRAGATRRRGPIYFPQPAAQSSPLVNLPVELIDEIYYKLKNIWDIICLSVTCQPLWELGRREIYRRVTLLISALSWAGDRIICVGDHLQNDDIPEHILTPVEKEKFTRQKLTPDEDHDSAQHYTLYNYPFRDLRYGQAEFNMCEFLLRCGSRLPHYVYDVFLPMVNLPYTTSQPIKSESTAVLRNLTRHQYVRESALSPWRARSGRTGFGEIILSRVCCSSDPSASMAYEGNIHRGVWAGDRFDVVSSEWLEGLDNNDGVWRDVSDEVLEEMLLIWASKY